MRYSLTKILTNKYPSRSRVAPDPRQLPVISPPPRSHPADISTHGMPRLPLMDIFPHPSLYRTWKDGPIGHSASRRIQHLSERTVKGPFSLPMTCSLLIYLFIQ